MLLLKGYNETGICSGVCSLSQFQNLADFCQQLSLWCFMIVCQVLDHLCFLGKLKDKGYSSSEAAAALLLFDSSVEKVNLNYFHNTRLCFPPFSV